MAAFLGIDTGRLKVVSITQGSVIINFAIVSPAAIGAANGN
jgi:hypothetical protein